VQGLCFDPQRTTAYLERERKPQVRLNSALRGFLDQKVLDRSARRVSIGEIDASTLAREMRTRQIAISVRGIWGRRQSSPREGSALPRGGRNPPDGFAAPPHQNERKTGGGGRPPSGSAGASERFLNETPRKPAFSGEGLGPPLGRAERARGRAQRSRRFHGPSPRIPRQIAGKVGPSRWRDGRAAWISEQNSGKAHASQGRAGSSPGEERRLPRSASTLQREGTAIQREGPTIPLARRRSRREGPARQREGPTIDR